MASKQPKHAAPVSEQKKIDTKKEFDKAKESMILIIKAQIKNLDRIDALVDAYNAMHSFGIEATVNMAQATIEGMKVDAENLLEIIKDLKYEDFTKKDMDDPLSAFIPDRHGITTLENMFDAYSTWSIYRPFGEKIENLHALVYETLEAQGELK